MDSRKQDFTLKQLRTFACVAREGSFSNAAEQLGISQPAVSSHIAVLEAKLGCQLFVRRRGATPTLTSEGEKLLRDAEDILNASLAMRENAPQNENQQVRLCIGPYLRDAYLKPLLPGFYRDHPNIDLVLLNPIPRHEVPSALEKNHVDLVVYSVRHKSMGWPNERLIDEVPVMMVAAKGTADQLADGEADIQDIQFIVHPAETAMRHWLYESLEDKCLELRKPLRFIEFPEVVQQMVEDGQGASILMYDQVRKSLEEGRMEVIGPEMPPMRRLLAMSPTAPPAARIVRDILIKHLAVPKQ